MKSCGKGQPREEKEKANENTIIQANCNQAKMRRFEKLNPTKYWLPNIPLTLMPPSRNLPSNKFVLRVQPDITKIELRNYISGLYGVSVTKVNTMNYEGKLKRAPRRGKFYSTKRYKKAIITTDDTIRADDFQAEGRRGT
jgi:ribosomal protein L23